MKLNLRILYASIALAITPCLWTRDRIVPDLPEEISIIPKGNPAVEYAKDMRRAKMDVFQMIMQVLMEHDKKVQQERTALLYSLYNNMIRHEPSGMEKPIDIPQSDVEKEIIIVTCSYNNQEWYQWNLNSVFSQKYTNYRLIYVDDCSADSTAELVVEYVKRHNQEGRVTFIQNKQRRRALANLYDAITGCSDEAIIVILDGDDRFAHDKVLAYINNVYADPAIWLTYGQFREYPSGAIGFCQPMPEWVTENNAFRSYPDTPSHLRTFYAGLFKRIKKEDLLYEDGEFFPMTYDLAMMFPMMEMARNGHFRFIPEVLLDYNAVNPLNDHKVSKDLQRRCDLIIRGRSRYEALYCLFDE